ncbi:MAG TPA: hypothetical protein VL769_04985 [Acidimicrobiia bacterium]|jgi:hypothetical protein|nr:hypothetical protein [Acidimicrobiia bacterium]
MRTATALLLLLILAACGSGYKGPAGRSPKVAFCDLYRRDAGDGRLRNWDLNDNAKTASYTETLRALNDAAPSALKSDIAPILSYYAGPPRHLSLLSKEYHELLASGARVLAYVHDTCGIDTAATPPGDTTPAQSKAEFVRQALVICAERAAITTKISGSVGSKLTIQQVKDTYANRIIPKLHDEVAQLRALNPPAADRKTISKMLDDLSTGIDQAATAIKSLKRTQDLGSLTEPPGLKAAGEEATAYGIGQCATP